MRCGNALTLRVASCTMNCSGRLAQLVRAPALQLDRQIQLSAAFGVAYIVRAMQFSLSNCTEVAPKKHLYRPSDSAFRMPTVSSIPQTWSDTPASIAGVTRKV